VKRLTGRISITYGRRMGSFSTAEGAHNFRALARENVCNPGTRLHPKLKGCSSRSISSQLLLRQWFL
jgi:hypothetical protein